MYKNIPEQYEPKNKSCLIPILQDLQNKNVINICGGTDCHLKNSANVLIALETELNIKSCENTRDKQFTLETVACIGACSITPSIKIYYE